MAFAERAKGTDIAFGDADQQRLVARGDPPHLNCRVKGPEKFHPARPEVSRRVTGGADGSARA